VENASHKSPRRGAWVALLTLVVAALALWSWIFRGSSPAAPEPTPSLLPAASPETGGKPTVENAPGRAAIAASSAQVARLPPWASPCTVTGRVVDRHGNPIAGARLSLATLRGPGSESAVVDCESGAHGLFECSVVHAFSYEYSLKVLAPGFLERDVEHASLLPPTCDLGLIVLDPGSTLTGRVLDKSGASVADAAIRLVRSANEWMNRDDPGAIVGHSSADGSFALEGIPGDGIRLAAEKGRLHSDWTARITIPPDGAASGISIVVEQALLVRGRVRERVSGAPLSAEIRILCTPGNWLVEAKSGSDGEFSAWAARPFSALTCAAQASGYASGGGTGLWVGSLESSIEYLTLELYPIKPVDIVVEDEGTGAPLASAELAWISSEISHPQDTNPHLYDGLGASASADAQGRIHQSALPDRAWAAVVRAPAHAPRVLDRKELTPSGAHVRLASGGTVRVQTLAGGVPAPGIRVELCVAADSTGDYRALQLLPKDSRALLTVRESDASGEASFADLAPGECTIQVRDSTHASHPLPELTVVAGQTCRVTVDVGSACSIAGRVSRDGAPVPGILVLARDVDQHIRRIIDSSDGPYETERAHSYTAMTNQDGRYRIDGLPSGIYGVATIGQEKGYDSKRIETPKAHQVVLAGGQRSECDLELEGTVTIRGTVIVNGRKRYGLRVDFNMHRSGESRFLHIESVTDCEGGYALLVPSGATGNISVHEEREHLPNADLAERREVVVSEVAAPLDFDVAEGRATFEFVRKGASVQQPPGSRLILKPRAEAGGVAGFANDHTWYIGVGNDTGSAQWTAPAGSFVVCLELPAGGRGPESHFTILPDEIASAIIETEPVK
jgi:hypothetical protein